MSCAERHAVPRVPEFRPLCRVFPLQVDVCVCPGPGAPQRSKAKALLW
jgi:hypothetical protein